MRTMLDTTSVNIQDVWQRYTGINVDVAVVDDGVDLPMKIWRPIMMPIKEASGVDGFPTGPGILPTVHLWRVLLAL